MRFGKNTSQKHCVASFRGLIMSDTLRSLLQESSFSLLQSARTLRDDLLVLRGGPVYETTFKSQPQCPLMILPESII